MVTYSVSFRVMVILCNTRLDSVKHLINRVLELDEESELPTGRIDTASAPALQNRLLSLQPKSRVFGCGGCGSNTVARLEHEDLFDDDYVRGIAVNTDAQHLLRVAVQNKILIGRSARGRGAGGDPEKGEQAAYESERSLSAEIDSCDIAFITAVLGGGT